VQEVSSIDSHVQLTIITNRSKHVIVLMVPIDILQVSLVSQREDIAYVDLTGVAVILS
jgi:hypothetical protein